MILREFIKHRSRQKAASAVLLSGVSLLLPLSVAISADGKPIEVAGTVYRIPDRLWTAAGGEGELPDSDYQFIVSGFYNEDTCEDLLFLSRSHYFFAVSDCRGGLAAGPRRPWAAPAEILSIQAASLDNRGSKNDLFVESRTGRFAVLNAAAESGLPAAARLNLPEVSGQTHAADFDGDGHSDLVVVSDTVSAYARRVWSVFQNTGAEEPAFEFAAACYAHADLQNVTVARVMDTSAEQLYASSEDGRQWQIFLRRHDGSCQAVRTAEFFGERKFLPAAKGHFFGGGTENLLLRDESGERWSVMLQGARIAVSRPVAVPFRKPAGGVYALDLNSDNLSDLIAFETDRSRYKIFFTAAGPPVAGVELVSDLGRTESGKDGNFRLSSSANQLIVARHENYSFLRVAPWPAGPNPIGAFPVSGDNYGSAYTAAGQRAVGPAICIGFREEPNDLGSLWGYGFHSCPIQYAVFGYDDPAAGEDALQLSCCPLPHPYLLSERHLFVEKQCPPNSVVTGAAIDKESGARRLRCTELMDKFRLGPVSSGRYFGSGLSMRGQRNPVTRNLIPLAIRYGIARFSLRHWDSDGCVGYPWGSVLVGVAGEKCDDSNFAEVFATDFPEQPLQMFPDCSKLDDIYSPVAGCRPARGDSAQAARP